jgi:hypothetical protein
MTTQQLHLANGLYLIVLTVVAFITRATTRRILGALAGGAAFGLVALAVIPLVERLGWWRVPITWEPYYLALLYLDFVLSCAWIYLVLWRVVRRFGSRGLAVSVAAAVVVGPVRDYRAAARFPDWMVFGPGVAPCLADAAVYVLMVVVGYGVMRCVAGPAWADSLARRTSDRPAGHAPVAAFDDAPTGRGDEPTPTS